MAWYRRADTLEKGATYYLDITNPLFAPYRDVLEARWANLCLGTASAIEAILRQEFPNSESGLDIKTLGIGCDTPRTIYPPLLWVVFSSDKEINRAKLKYDIPATFRFEILSFSQKSPKIPTRCKGKK